MTRRMRLCIPKRSLYTPPMLETKGDDRDNSDSKRKLKLGRHWQSQCGTNYRYFMVFDSVELDGAYTVDGVIDIIKNL